jgi:hypothetical protein
MHDALAQDAGPTASARGYRGRRGPGATFMVDRMGTPRFSWATDDDNIQRTFLRQDNAWVLINDDLATGERIVANVSPQHAREMRSALEAAKKPYEGYFPSHALFPSFLFHRTLSYAGPGERINISFDLAAV